MKSTKTYPTAAKAREAAERQMNAYPKLYQYATLRVVRVEGEGYKLERTFKRA